MNTRFFVLPALFFAALIFLPVGPQTGEAAGLFRGRRQCSSVQNSVSEPCLLDSRSRPRGPIRLLPIETPSGTAVRVIDGVSGNPVGPNQSGTVVVASGGKFRLEVDVDNLATWNTVVQYALISDPTLATTAPLIPPPVAPNNQLTQSTSTPDTITYFDNVTPSFGLPPTDPPGYNVYIVIWVTSTLTDQVQQIQRLPKRNGTPNGWRIKQ
jgi:hypothetical protein